MRLLNWLTNLTSQNKMGNPKSIGNKIATLRKQNNLSQAELGKKVSISTQAVGKWERGESLPDILTLQRITKIFEVDLNYFSEPSAIREKHEKQPANPVKSSDLGWDMSSVIWRDADFSGIDNLTDKFNESDIKNCKFIGSGLSNLKLKSNQITNCDFTKAIIRSSKIHTSTFSECVFVECSLEKAEFKKSDLDHCDVTKSNLVEASFSDVSFQANIVKQTVWDNTSFKNTSIIYTSFDGTLDGCFFENCSFKNVRFQNVTIRNTFFRHNRKLDQVQFENCRVDKATYAFLKNDGANLQGIELID